jgi:small nuclear ribonucleoprotein (snRNP)-like protein
MLFFSFFKTLVDHEVTVELKNEVQIRGTLKSVDQYLNIKLDDISVVEEFKYPHLVSGGAGREEGRRGDGGGTRKGRRTEERRDGLGTKRGRAASATGLRNVAVGAPC